MSKLVIVESPAKARKLRGWLPKEYIVEASVGHVRDLPSKDSQVPKKFKDEPGLKHGVIIGDTFQAIYVVTDARSKKVIAELKKKAKDADELYLATDPDREGEAISWHLLEELRKTMKKDVPIKRVVFNEVTKKAILKAFDATREIDEDLVSAQETRRILDRLYGFELSPLLWQKIQYGLSAGRVQSPALRLLVERERARMKFEQAEYWDLKATLEEDAKPFEAEIVTLAGKTVVTGKKFFDDETGKFLDDPGVTLLDEKAAKALVDRLQGSPWTIAEVDEKPRRSNPKEPFISDTLIQESNNRLGLSADMTMRTAQTLYQNGFITYHRTDSPALSDEGLQGSRAAVVAAFGKEYLNPETRQAKAKGGSAQEAHEAIRPAGDEFVLPKSSGLKGRDLDLYTLIWKRTLAFQMKPEESLSTTVLLDVDDARFKATGKKVTFPGWRKAYGYEQSQDTLLPHLQVGDTPTCTQLEAVGHETAPPARYTEGSLVAALKDAGVGRPSTYASILKTIQDRGFCYLRGKALVPTFTGFAVTRLLEQHFPDLVDLGFTANMEEVLDQIAEGKASWQEYLQRFWQGDEGLEKAVANRKNEIDPREASTLDIPAIRDLPVVIRVGRFGPYLETVEKEGKTPARASIPEDLTPDELTPEKVEELIKQSKEGPESLGAHPDNGQPIFKLSGRFGPYVQLGEVEGKEKPPRASIPRDWDAANLSLEDAVFLLSLPLELGPHPDGGTVAKGLGRYGPYVVHTPEGDSKPDYRNIKDVDKLRTITYEEAMEVLKQPKRGRGGGRAAAAQKVLKELGKHPKDGEVINVLDGRYGPYVKHGKTNASLPKGTDPQKFTLEQAVDLIAKKRKK